MQQLQMLIPDWGTVCMTVHYYPMQLNNMRQSECVSMLASTASCDGSLTVSVKHEQWQHGVHMQEARRRFLSMGSCLPSGVYLNVLRLMSVLCHNTPQTWVACRRPS